MKSILILAITLGTILGLVPSAARAESIGPVSRTVHETQILALWDFQEPDGGYTRFYVGILDRTVVEQASGEKDSTSEVCFVFTRLIATYPNNRVRSFEGCKPLEGGEFHLSSRLGDASLSTIIPVHCEYGLDCDPPEAITVDIAWTATGPLVFGHGLINDEVCHLNDKYQARPLSASGSVTDGLTGYTRGEGGTGTIIK